MTTAVRNIPKTSLQRLFGQVHFKHARPGRDLVKPVLDLRGSGVSVQESSVVEHLFPVQMMQLNWVFPLLNWTEAHRMKKVWIGQMVQEGPNSMSESLCRRSHRLGTRGKVSLSHKLGVFALLRMQIHEKP